MDEHATKSKAIERQPKQIDDQPVNWPESFTAGYRIPKDNPWVGSNGKFLEEFYAIGLRNPYKATMDDVTGDVWIADVGQGREEEINLLAKGANYEWVYKEGFSNYNLNRKPSNIQGTETPPIFSYRHSNGDKCIIGGYVYRGNEFDELKSKYIYGDYISGKIWQLTYNGSGNATSKLLIDTEKSISSFGTDHDGNLYVLALGSGRGIFKLTKKYPNNAYAPEWLSQTGAFTNLDQLTPAKGLIPYEPKVPFWSDGAKKYRWMAIPNNGTYNSTSERIVYSQDDFWKFPIGTVFIKHIELPLIKGKSSPVRKVETRFLVRGEDGNYFGFTYKWLADGSDAQLLAGSLTETINVEDENGNSIPQNWIYPSREECFNCHTEAAGRVLGVNARQLNHDFTYPSTGIKANQIATLRALGVLGNAPTDQQIQSIHTLAGLNDNSRSLELRVRSYIDVNCAYCHRPESGIRANFDARITTSLENQKIINGSLLDNMGTSGAKVVVPGNPSLSFLYTRMNSVDGGEAMPPLAKNVVDSEGAKVIKDWINSLTSEPDSITLNCEYSINDQTWVKRDCTVEIEEGDRLEIGVDPNFLVSALWTGPNGFSKDGGSNGRTLVADPMTPLHSGTYYVVATNSSGAVGTKSIEVIVKEVACNQAPTVVMESKVNGGSWNTQPDNLVTVKQGDQLTLSANPNSAQNYQWTGPNNFSKKGNNGGDALISNNIQLNQAGIYTVELTTTDGCIGTGQIEVKVIPSEPIDPVDYVTVTDGQRILGDSYTNNEPTFQKTNYGNKGVMYVRNKIGWGYESYISFGLDSYESIENAVLRVYGRNPYSNASVKVGVYGTSTGWDELQINYSNAPVPTQKPIDQNTISGSAKYYEWDVTEYIKNLSAGSVSFALRSLNTNYDHIEFTTKEGNANIPQLVIRGTKQRRREVSLDVLADTYTNNVSQFRDYVHGDKNVVEVRNKSSWGYESFLKFDLSELSSNASIVNAQLKVYGSNPKNNTAVNVQVSETADNWKEMELSYNNAPVPGKVIGSMNVTNTLQYYTLDVTDYVKKNASGDKVASFVLQSINAGYERATFHSKEARDYAPQLIIQLDEGANAQSLESIDSADDLLSQEELDVTVYPNPFSRYLSIRVSGESGTESYSVEIVDMMGRVVKEERAISLNQEITFDVKGETGMYFLNILRNGMAIKTTKLIHIAE